MTDGLSAPIDVKLMNIAASALLLTVLVMALATTTWWALRHPRFSITSISVHGDLIHNNAVTLRANVTPRISGNLFTLDMVAVRSAFEGVPWVRKAVVRRQFPNHLSVHLQEHQPVAYWGAETESRMLNSLGEVFEANIGDVESEVLPRLTGPQGRATDLLAMHRALAALFGAVDVGVEKLDLSERGSWRAQLDTGTVIELGRGSQDEILARTWQFVFTSTQATASYNRTPDLIESADLRHVNGYALRLRGVTTVSAQAQTLR